MNKTDIIKSMQEKTSSEVALQLEALDFDLYPSDLINRMADELKYLQSIAGSIAKPGDQARLNCLVTDWEYFNQ